MTTAATAGYPAELHLDADHRISRWRPFVHWLLAVPHLVIINALQTVRGILTLVSFFTVLFRRRIPQTVFDAIAMTYRYEWRTLSYTAFMHEAYPPFEFSPTAEDDGRTPHVTLSIEYPEELGRWKPLYKWFLAIPHYFVFVALAIAGILTLLWCALAVAVTGRYPEPARRFLVGAYRYGLRVQAYVGLLTDQYPPFRLRA